MSNPAESGSNLPLPPSDSSRAAVLSVQHVNRTVKAYLVQESEVRSLSVMNGIGILFFGIGSALLSLAGSIWIAAAMVDPLPQSAAYLPHDIAPLMAALSFLCFLFVAWAAYQGSETWKTIKRESSQ